jgi:hypothetical protein
MRWLLVLGINFRRIFLRFMFDGPKTRGKLKRNGCVGSVPSVVGGSDGVAESSDNEKKRRRGSRTSCMRNSQWMPHSQPIMCTKWTIHTVKLSVPRRDCPDTFLTLQAHRRQQLGQQFGTRTFAVITKLHDYRPMPLLSLLRLSFYLNPPHKLRG